MWVIGSQLVQNYDTFLDISNSIKLGILFGAIQIKIKIKTQIKSWKLKSDSPSNGPIATMKKFASNRTLPPDPK